MVLCNVDYAMKTSVLMHQFLSFDIFQITNKLDGS